MKKQIYIFLKGVGTVILTAGIVLAVDLGINLKSGEPIAKSIWDTLTSQLEANTDKNTAQDTKIAELLAEINALKIKVNGTAAATNVYTKTQINNLLGAKADKSYIDSGLAGKANTDHNHNNLYYTESEINIKLENLEANSDQGIIVGMGVVTLTAGNTAYASCQKLGGQGNCNVKSGRRGSVQYICPDGTIKKGLYGDFTDQGTVLCLKN